jgi:hypothetical protein
MASYNKFNQFVEDLAEKVHNLGADTLKVMLVNSPAPVATNSVKADLTEISAGNGYSAGGTQAAISSSVHTSGTYKLVLADVVFTAAAGTIGPFRYPVLYNDTPASPLDPLIAWHDYGSSITLQDTETFTWDANASTGILTIA